MNDNAFSVGACPAEYRDKLFLTPADIMDILGISENSCYRYLQSDLPFTKVKVGKLIRVNARSCVELVHGKLRQGAWCPLLLVVSEKTTTKTTKLLTANFFCGGECS